MDKSCGIVLTALVLVSSGPLLGQESNRDQPNGVDAEAERSGMNEMGGGGSMHSEERQMWNDIASMSRQCEAMMRGEMTWRPVKMAVVIIAGTAGVVALILLIVLEIQTIRWLGLRTKREREMSAR